MRQLLWFILGVAVAISGQALAQVDYTDPNWPTQLYRQQLETQTMQNFNNTLNEQRYRQTQPRNPC